MARLVTIQYNAPPKINHGLKLGEMRTNNSSIHEKYVLVLLYPSFFKRFHRTQFLQRCRSDANNYHMLYRKVQGKIRKREFCLIISKLKNNCDRKSYHQHYKSLMTTNISTHWVKWDQLSQTRKDLHRWYTHIGIFSIILLEK